MLVKILLLVFLAVIAALLLFVLYAKKRLSAKGCALTAVVCAAVLCAVGIYFYVGRGAAEPKPVEKPQTLSAREEGRRTMDMIMWYDIDTGPTTNGRPQRGWWPLNPQHPDTVQVSGNYRTTTPLMGLYDQRDPETARQHLYWMSALGCNSVAVDWTNYTSYRLETPGQDWYKYTYGVYANTEVLLKEASASLGFESPKIYITVRLSGENYDALNEVLTDVYTLYEQYPDAWYRLQDGTDRASKPFLIIFIDSELQKKVAEGTEIFDDERFNIRFSNGYLSPYTEEQKDGSKSISGDVPLWFFVESEEDPDAGEGMYRIFHKDAADGSVEQMIAWASLHKGGENWDELNHIVNGQTTFERTLRGVAELSPKALLINRFNYAMAWKEQPQEGVSLYGSTHIEPNVDFGFLVFDNVKTNLYKLNYWKQEAPPAPEVLSSDDDALFLSLDGYPTEYRISFDAETQGEWVYYNINDGVELPEERDGNVCYIQTRNTFGESTVTEYTIPSES